MKVVHTKINPLFLPVQDEILFTTTAVNCKYVLHLMYSVVSYILQGMYSGISNNHTLCIYSFPRKILPYAFIGPVLNSSTMTALCKQLLDSPE